MDTVQLCRIFSLFAAISMVTGTSALGEVYFAGDHYKVQGAPKIKAAIVNPVVVPGENATLKLILANCGSVESLVPRGNSTGFEAEAACEMTAELACANAINLEVKLRSAGPIKEISGPVQIDILEVDEAKLLEFQVFINEDASGTYSLPLNLDYERQIDVSVTEDQVSPLYVPVEEKLNVEVEVVGNNAVLKIAGTESDLFPGKEGGFVLAVKNEGQTAAKNCSARLTAKQPFRLEKERAFLGDLGPGEVEVAIFKLGVDRDAKAQEHQLTLEITYDGGVVTQSLSAEVGRSKAHLSIAFLALTLATSGLVLIRKGRKDRTKRPGSLRKRRISDIAKQIFGRG